MIQSQSKDIGGCTYTVQQLGVAEGRRCLVRLAKTLGPVLGALMEEDPGPGKAKVGSLTTRVMDMDVKSIARALDRLAETLEADDLDYLCRIFGERTMVQTGDKAIKLDLNAQEMHFVGRYDAMFRWLAFCLEVNYRDFFVSMAGMANASQPAERVSSE